MALTDIIGQAQDVVNTAAYLLLDGLYSSGAVILENPVAVFKQNKSLLGLELEIPVPLIGFNYKPEGTIELLKYQWSEYPYLNKQVLTNAAIKQTTKFSVQVIDPISGNNPVLLALLKREGLKMLLEKYTDAGGMFTVMTLWGAIKHCVLTDLAGVSGEAMDGTNFIMSFMKPNINIGTADKQLSDFMSNAQAGGAS